MTGLSFGCPASLSTETDLERSVAFGVLARADRLRLLPELLGLYSPEQQRDLRYLMQHPEHDHAVRGETVDDAEAQRRYVEGYGGMAVTG